MGANDWETTRGAHNPPKSPKIRSSPLKWKFQTAYWCCLVACLCIEAREAQQVEEGERGQEQEQARKKEARKLPYRRHGPSSFKTNKKRALRLLSVPHVNARERYRDCDRIFSQDSPGVNGGEHGADIRFCFRRSRRRLYRRRRLARAVPLRQSPRHTGVMNGA